MITWDCYPAMPINPGPNGRSPVCLVRHCGSLQGGDHWEDRSSCEESCWILWQRGLLQGPGHVLWMVQDNRISETSIQGSPWGHNPSIYRNIHSRVWQRQDRAWWALWAVRQFAPSVNQQGTWVWLCGCLQSCQSAGQPASAWCDQRCPSDWSVQALYP